MLTITCSTCGIVLDHVEGIRTAYCHAPGYSHSCRRSCPVCEADDPELLHQIPFSDGKEQDVSICKQCGMGYASKTPKANYENDSIYAAVDAVGSGNDERDRNRHKGTVEIIEKYFPDKAISVLDIGCAQGGLLAELDRAGYENAMGIDPSQVCVDACLAKELIAVRSTLEDAPAGRYDLVILSHVLEHVWDVPKAIESVRARLKNGGHCYIEVPDASRYADFLVCPFLDFNREHINHFSMMLLSRVLHQHKVLTAGSRDLQLPSGLYPAFYFISPKEPDADWTPYHSQDGWYWQKMKQYVSLSLAAMDRIDQQLSQVLQFPKEIAIWGYGEFAQQLFLTQALKSAHVVQIVDRNSRKQGMRFHDLFVESPEKLRSDVPILVASILNKDSIIRDFDKMQRHNPLITVSL